MTKLFIYIIERARIQIPPLQIFIIDRQIFAVRTCFSASEMCAKYNTHTHTRTNLLLGNKFGSLFYVFYIFYYIQRCGIIYISLCRGVGKRK